MRARALAILAGLTLAASSLAQAQGPAKHMGLTPKDLVWGPAPPVFRPGAEVAILEGDLGGSGVFTVRMKAPAGYKIMPHWHPTSEYVTVLSGTVVMGHGDTIDEKSGETLTAGSFMAVPAESHHYLVVKTAAIVQVHATGPFAITYVNPADDPRNAAAK